MQDGYVIHILLYGNECWRKKTRGSRNGVLRKEIETPMNTTNKQQESFFKNGENSKKNYT